MMPLKGYNKVQIYKYISYEVMHPSELYTPTIIIEPHFRKYFHKSSNVIPFPFCFFDSLKKKIKIYTRFNSLEHKNAT